MLERIPERIGGWKTLMASAQEKHGDYDEVAFNDEFLSSIPPRGILDVWLLNSDHGAEMLYFLGKDRALLTRIVSAGFVGGARLLLELEDRLSDAARRSQEVRPEPVQAEPYDFGSFCFRICQFTEWLQGIESGGQA